MGGSSLMSLIEGTDIGHQGDNVIIESPSGQAQQSKTPFCNGATYDVKSLANFLLDAKKRCQSQRNILPITQTRLGSFTLPLHDEMHEAKFKEIGRFLCLDIR